MRNAQSGRRRGRGNPRPQQGGRDMGNRMEPRQRGNAHQLLEKYNNLARDAQQQGDRVQAEYYMQYADHYHRVVAEMRARQEDKQAQQHQHQSSRRSQDEDDAAEDERMLNGSGSRRAAAERRDERDEADREDPGEAEDEGALRTLARRAAPAESAGEGETESEPRPKRGRGRRRTSRAAGEDAGEENSEATLEL
jgi:hypothetical protein